MSNIDTLSFSKAGKIFTGANISAKLLAVVGTAMTGGILYNPIGSGKKLIILDAGWSWTTVSGAVHSIGLGSGAVSIIVPASTTVATTAVQCADGSGTAGVAKYYDVATLPAANVAVRWFSGANWLTTGTGTHPYKILDNIDGELSVVPGATLSFICVGTAPVGLSSMTWVEADL
jgi:hypothetical protein